MNEFNIKIIVEFDDNTFYSERNSDDKDNVTNMVSIATCMTKEIQHQIRKIYPELF